MALQIFKSTGDLNLVNNSQAALLSKRGTTYYVDANSGVDTRLGKSWRKAFLTMSKAFSVIESGDTIIFVGRVKEQLTTPVGVFDITVRGAGSGPARHQDGYPAGANTSGGQWANAATPVADTALVKVLHQGWRFENIMFSPPSDAEAITFFRNLGVDAAERDSRHGVVTGCAFVDGLNGIGSNGQPADIEISNNLFQDATGFAIRHSILEADAGAANPQFWQILNNRFFGNANHVKLEASKFRIEGNTFDDGGTPNTTAVLDLGTSGGNNFVVKNYFQTSSANFNTPDIVGYATDVWNNYSIDGADLSAGSVGLEVGQPA